jgi:hypothetical protein
MKQTELSLANFLIAGADKAGTTSVFVYLSQHPEVSAAIKKETDFFRDGYKGDRQNDIMRYAGYFRGAAPKRPITMEASPGYLADAEIVAPRIKELIPDSKILFILREPIDRLFSSFNFHVGRLNIPDTMAFPDFIDECMAYERGEVPSVDLGLNEWCLRALGIGRYVDYLRHYYDQFPPNKIKVMFFESLRDDALGFMTELSEFLEIDPGFWSGYEFRKSNVTFAGRNKFLHRMALHANNMAEPILRQRPGLKHAIVNFYKALNKSEAPRQPIPEDLYWRLKDYYETSNLALKELLNVDLPDNWLLTDDQRARRLQR